MTMHRYMIITLVATLVTYVASMYCFNSVLDFYIIKDAYTIGWILLLSFISYFPFKVFQFFEKKFRAEVVDKLKNIDNKKSFFFN